MPASISSPPTTASRCDDLVSYNDKHNQANGEDNRDGDDNNRSWNCGAEGLTEDAAIIALRARQKRNLLATLFLSQGVPMLVAGDEMGRSQGGNNNAYCQDNVTSWVNWDLSAADREFLCFVQALIALRREHPVFHRRHFFQGRDIRGSGSKDIHWFKPDGLEMSDEEWVHDFARCLGVFLSGEAMHERDGRGRPIRDDNFLLLFNSHHEAVAFKVPLLGEDREWTILLDTAQGSGVGLEDRFRSGDSYPLEARSLAVMVQRSRS